MKKIFILLIFLFSTYILTKNLNSKTKILNVAVDLKQKSATIDPLNIPTLTDAFFINHLYGNLVELDDQHNLIASLAESFRWENTNELVFKFQEKSLISAIDAQFNLKRIIYSKRNLHGDLFDLICSPAETTNDCLERIQIVNGELRINVYNHQIKKYLLSTLCSIDYKIIPIAAFNTNDFRNAYIINYKITSGHYYIDATNHLKRNTHSDLKFENSIQEFKIIDTDTFNLSENISKNLIDIVSTTVSMNKESEKTASLHNWHVFETYPISVFFLSFSKKSLSHFSVQSRFAIANKIAAEINPSSFFKINSTPQFIQNFGEGYLNSTQLNNVLFLRKTLVNYNQNLNRKIKLGVRNIKRWTAFAKINSEFKLQMLPTGSVLNMRQEEMPDVFGLTNDVSFETNYALLAFAVKNNFLHSKLLNSREIMKKFLRLENDEEKINFINEIHNYSIQNCIIFPIYASPYTTLTNSSLIPNQSKYNSRTLLWKIKEI